MAPARAAALGTIALAAIAVAAAGCKGKRTPPRGGDAAAAAAIDAAASAPAAPWVSPIAVIDSVEVALHGATEHAIVSHELGRRLARCLIESGDDAVALDRQADPVRAAHHARIAVALDATRATVDGAPHIAVSYDATVHWQGAGAAPPSIETRVVGQASIIGDALETAILAVTETLQPEVCRTLAARLDLVADPRRYLADADPDVALFALQAVVRHPPPGALEALVPLLDRPGPVGDAAIAALVALRDPRAVPALTALDLSDRARLTSVIAASIAIGGDDAVDFLEVMSAHADPAIARHARDGVAELRARAGGAESVGSFPP